MDRTLDFANVNWGRILNHNNATQTHSIFVKLKENIGFPNGPSFRYGNFFTSKN